MFESKNYDYARDIDPINLKIAIDRIKTIVNTKMKNMDLISKEFNIFEFDNKETCPLTGYFIHTLFIGPHDDHDYYKKNNILSAYDEIEKIILTYNTFKLYNSTKPTKFIYYVKS